MTIAELYSAVKSHVKDNYGEEMLPLKAKYGEKMAEDLSIK